MSSGESLYSIPSNLRHRSTTVTTAEVRDTLLGGDLGARLPMPHRAARVDGPGHTHRVLAVHII